MHFLKFLIVFLLVSCQTRSVDKMAGIVDPQFTQVIPQLDSSGQLISHLLFKPNIFAINSEATVNEYMVSFSILKSNNIVENAFYNHVNAFITFKNAGTLEEPQLYYSGLVIKNCPNNICDSIFTAFKNERGEDLVSGINSISRNQEDGFFHLQAFIHPIHKGEPWRAIHGYPGTVKGIPQILYPYYRVDFTLPSN